MSAPVEDAAELGVTDMNAKRSLWTTVATLALAACNAATSATPTPGPTATASPTTAAASPTTAPSATPVAILPGEPWILHEWFLPQTTDDAKDLLLARPDGSDRHGIAIDVPGDHRSARWSPDGERIAFAVLDGEKPRAIWLADAEGNHGAPLFDPASKCPGGANNPSWSPDGTRLAIICDTTVNNLAIVEVATGALRIVATIRYPEFVDNPVSWSPDGKTLAFDIAHEVGDGRVDGWLIATVPTAGGEIRRLTDFDFFAARPDWLPTDGLLAFNTYDVGHGSDLQDYSDQPANIYTIRPDGSDLRQLTTASTDGQLRIGHARWAPDGSLILVSVATGDLEVGFVDPLTGALTYPATRFFGVRPDLRPTP